MDSFDEELARIINEAKRIQLREMRLHLMNEEMKLALTAPDAPAEVEQPIFIYVLSDPNTWRVRYVGQTNDPRRRYKEHCRAKEDTYKGHWIRSLQRQRPVMTIVDATDRAHAHDLERWWILTMRARGAPITNLDMLDTDTVEYGQPVIASRSMQPYAIIALHITAIVCALVLWATGLQIAGIITVVMQVLALVVSLQSRVHINGNGVEVLG